jgi:hypothetical protein
MTTPQYLVCIVPVAPLRQEASHREEQVSQVLLGEKMHLLAPPKNGWLYVACEWDGYCGWILESQVAGIDKKNYTKSSKCIVSNTNSRILDTELNAGILLPLGANLPFFKKSKFHHDLLGANAIFKGKKLLVKNIISTQEVAKFWAMQYIGAPYIWGGRTHMGIDCSGFVQMVYKMQNVRLKRDACQQAEQGEDIDFLQNAQCGDVAFFDNEEGKIIHVGMLLSNDTIIHATSNGGGVVIDKIDTLGIISSRLRRRTHQLRLIKRFI